MTKFEFLVGNNFPTSPFATASFVLLAVMSWYIFGVPVKGSVRHVRSEVFIMGPLRRTSDS